MRKEDFIFYNLRSGQKGNDINIIFPGWKPHDERVVVFSPHDDDGILGPGSLIQGIPLFGGDVHIIIFCNGSGGYSVIEQKYIITALRSRETARAYNVLGIKEEKIHRLEYDDYSVFPFIGHKLPGGEEGTFRKIMPLLRKLKITRVLVPNGYREHLDHTATYMVGAFDTPQIGDPVMVDWGQTEPIRSILQYAVWSDFSPEDAMVEGVDTEIRANRALKAPIEAEKNILKAMEEYQTQAKIISGLLKAREERIISKNQVAEVFLSFEPRPRCEYKKYIHQIEKIDNSGGQSQ
ncbi:MAG TPA: PIG-L family deacetylase [Atribacter sp.]|jgi:LmbE family N-acetylglucosaminyl deacetylase|uniref:GlcNAc-PI de-N-acetylase n=1 Tax=Candidatus Atribacter allofermentans TaxID=1852833 RepID=A0A1V5SR68_9BACT|nr:PIG-L family deacetylase [Atribacter sp.]MDI9593676.1 PIG-L family deacetylase [Atribacterota bacterium]OQA56452.1 MAG: GlcNAc-PI de-N-acetylase [Candidatus Atribacteria bacterium ADurb.Bin276]HHT11498.1 PIG-L family deacetylase [Candidatus Atribacteria bacterium]HOT05604.1 PIG-L family deacetylase [Atribacter sp.]HQK82697.1 PIG-L family deacetylase [Atribacter sp.]